MTSRTIPGLKACASLEGQDERKRRVKNSWQKSLRDKTKDLIGRLEGMLPEGAIQAFKKQRISSTSDVEVLEAACEVFRKAIWIQPDIVRDGLASSKSMLLAIVHVPSLAVQSASDAFWLQFQGQKADAKSARRPILIKDLAHQEDAPLMSQMLSLRHKPSILGCAPAGKQTREAHAHGVWVRFPASVPLATPTFSAVINIWQDGMGVVQAVDRRRGWRRGSNDICACLPRRARYRGDLRHML